MRLLLVESFVLLMLGNGGVTLDCTKSNSSYPREITKVCSVYYNSTLLVSGGKCTGQQSLSCEANVGMNIRADCIQESGDDVERIEIVKNNKVLTNLNSSSMLITSANISDSGQYECRTYFRREMEPVIAYFNITVSTEMAIAIFELFCDDPYTFNFAWSCCSTTKVFHLPIPNRPLVVLYAYNSNISLIEQEWITDAADHYHTDLGLYADLIPSNRNIQIGISNFPVFFNERDNVEVAAVVTVSHYYSNLSLSLYIKIKLSGSIKFAVNESLPKDAYAYSGRMAMFECEVISQSNDCSDRHIMEYHSRGNYTNITILNKQFDCSRRSDYFEHTDIYTLKISISIPDKLTKKTLYQFYVSNINSSSNNSFFTCSIKVDDQIQWQKNATLTVLQEDIQDLASTGQPNRLSYYVITIATPIGVCIIAIAIISTIIVPSVIIVIRNKRKNMWTTERGYPYDFSILSNEENTSDSDWKPSKNKSEIYLGDPTTKEVNIMQSYADVDSVKDMKTNQQNCCIVYISYADSQASWVYDYLKPLIESWNSQVILHEEDMVPGYTISEERQRLICEAHRIVLVMSEDYSNSPWCLYELQHAITKEPVLFKGRIIPVMVNGTNNMPEVLKGLVPLYEFDVNFEVKLKKNICGGT